MHITEINKLTDRETEYGPSPDYRPDSILQGYKIGELILSSNSDELHDVFDLINWPEIRPIGAIFLREIMSQMERQLPYGYPSKTVALLFKPLYEAWCAIRDVVNPFGIETSEFQIARLGLEKKRADFSNTMSGPQDDIQRLNIGHAPYILAVIEPYSGRIVSLYTFHRLVLPDEMTCARPAHPTMLRFAQDLTMLAYPHPHEPIA